MVAISEHRLIKTRNKGENCLVVAKNQGIRFGTCRAWSKKNLAEDEKSKSKGGAHHVKITEVHEGFLAHLLKENPLVQNTPIKATVWM